MVGALKMPSRDVSGVEHMPSSAPVGMEAWLSSRVNACYVKSWVLSSAWKKNIYIFLVFKTGFSSSYAISPGTL